LLERTAPALAYYAERHDYEMIQVRHRLDPSRPPAWDKVVLLRRLILEFDVVLWVDADALVLDDAPDIASELAPRRFLHLVEHRVDGARVPNTGVALLRGGSISARFLDRVWAQRRFVHHLWWENAATLHLLGYRNVAGMRPVVPSPWRLGLGLLDKAWNSIPADPSPRPHIVHFPGIPLADRLQLLESLSERR
jgi:hypothetical protein